MCIPSGQSRSLSFVVSRTGNRSPGPIIGFSQEKRPWFCSLVFAVALDVCVESLFNLPVLSELFWAYGRLFVHVMLSVCILEFRLCIFFNRTRCSGEADQHIALESASDKTGRTFTFGGDTDYHLFQGCRYILFNALKVGVWSILGSVGQRVNTYFVSCVLLLWLYFATDVLCRSFFVVVVVVCILLLGGSSPFCSSFV